MTSDRFEDWIAPYMSELTAYCYRMLGSIQDAEDARQEVLIRAWRAADRFEGRSSLRTWLLRIATNVCLTIHDRRARRELPVDLSGDAPAAERLWLEALPGEVLEGHPSPSAEARYELLEGVELAFVAALQYLPPAQRAALILRDVLGFSGSESAELLGASVAAVNSSLQRARQTIADRAPERSQQTELRLLGDEATRALAGRYAAAWERQDVDAIVAMLADHARYSMPPWSRWYRGRDTIRDFLLAAPLRYRWKFVPVEANGQLAFGTYAADGEGWRLAAIDVLTVRAGLIDEVTAFLDPGVVARFGIPARLVSA